jgi:hypothetical protein
MWKWNLEVNSASSAKPHHHTYSTQKWITARLLYLIENTGLRKFHIHPTPMLPPSPVLNEDTTSASYPKPTTPSILVWVFTPDLFFSSSIVSPGRLDPTRSMKVFYQQQTWKPLEPGEPESASIEDVEFPDELFEEMKKGLEESQELLPPTARKFQGWDVGLLGRFDMGDVVSSDSGTAEAGGGGADGDGQGVNDDDK